LSDEPASSSANFKVFNHRLQETATTFCAEPKLASKLKRGFPKSLNNAPALLPSDNTTLRRALENWFREQKVQPRVVAEFEDLALMKVMAAEGRGFIAVPSIATDDAVAHYGFRVIGQAQKCRVQYHAVTAERRIAHPAVQLVLRSQDSKAATDA
jgi:LysR family transcriptional activator of nhaA